MCTYVCEKEEKVNEICVQYIEYKLGGGYNRVDLEEIY